MGKTRAAVVVAVLPPLALAIAALTFGPRLGDQVASHWSGDASTPDGFTSTWGSFWVVAGVTAVLTAAAVAGIALAGHPRVSRLWTALAVLTAGSVAGAWIATAWATADAAAPAEAALGGRLAILVAAPVCAALVYAALPPTVPPQPADAAVPAARLHAGDRLAWSGTTGSGVLVFAVALVAVVFVGTLVVAVLTGAAAAWITAGVLFLAAGSAALLVPVRLTVDRRGVRLSSALLRVPLIRVRLDDIQSVTAGTIEPAQWGGWGYRISSAGVGYIARRGPGLIVRRRQGGAVAITIDHPEQPASVANALAAGAGHAG